MDLFGRSGDNYFIGSKTARAEKTNFDFQEEDDTDRIFLTTLKGHSKGTSSSWKFRKTSQNTNQTAETRVQTPKIPSINLI
jgi:hypothetical protein